MKVRRSQITILVLIAILLAPIPLPALNGFVQMQMPILFTVKPAEGQAAGTKSFVVYVSKDGFNGTHSSKLAITVNEGDRVQITFIMVEEERNNRDPSNKHEIEVTGYEILADMITPSNPETTITFLADKPGSFTIRCSSETYDCPGHENLQDGKFEVIPKGGAPQPAPQPAPVPQPAPAPAPAPAPQPPPPQPAPAPAPAPAPQPAPAPAPAPAPQPAPAPAPAPAPQQPAPPPPPQPQQPVPAPAPAAPPAPLKTDLRLNVDTQGYPDRAIALTAILKDNEGNPLVGMPLAFTVNTTFGLLRIGAPYTNKQGVASVNYSGQVLGTLEFAASFPGARARAG